VQNQENISEGHPPQFKGRNYVLSALEGGLFMGGMSFLSMEAVMPAMIRDLGGAPWAISLAPVLFIIGFGWPQVFSALWVERMRRMKPMLLSLGIIQRSVYLLVGLLLLLAGRDHPRLAVTAAFLAPFAMSTLGGIQGSAYFEFITRIVPVRRMASMWAIRNILMAVSGILAGFIIKWLLEACPGAPGYGILHLIAFTMMMGSLGVLSLIRETHVPEDTRQDPVSFRSGFSAFGKQWRENPSLGLFIVTRMLFMLVFVAIPFLSLRAIDRTGAQTSLVGLLVATQMVGFIAGNAMSGYLGDRYGVRIPMLLGRIILITALGGVLIATSQWQFMAVFFCIGFGISTAHVGDLTMVIDFAPPPRQRRKFFFAVMGVLIVPGVLSAALISAALQYLDHGFHVACLVSSVALVLSLVLLYRLKDPRHFPAPADPPPAASGS
jgi:MFS family permease